MFALSLMKKFTRGQFVIYQDRSAYVNFICEHYITLCLNEWKKSPEEAEHAISPIRQVNLCVNSIYWDKILPDPERPFNRFSTGKLWKTLNKSRCVFYLSRNVFR